MDKETLSNYGWIVICTLVLVVMIALSTPFGSYVGSAVKNTTESLFSSSASAMDTVLTEMGAEPVGRPDGIKFETANGTVGGSESTASQGSATFVDKILNCQHHEDCEYGWHWDDCWQPGEPVTLTWEQLKDPANGEKYGYDASKITDTSMSDTAFYYCESLTSATIPNSVTSIGRSAFSCTSLSSVVIPNSVTSIGDFAFAGTFLSSVVIPNSVTSIGESAFNWCVSLTSVTIPSSVTSIGGGAFCGCQSLASITIPNSVTSIEYNAFYNCQSLASVTIPNGITSIGDSAFGECTSLTDINYQGAEAQWEAIDKCDNEYCEWNCNCHAITVHCTDGDIVVPAWEE